MSGHARVLIAIVAGFTLTAAAASAAGRADATSQVAQVNIVQPQGSATPAVQPTQQPQQQGIDVQDVTPGGANVPAADFTFNVPLELVDLHPDVDRAKVICVAITAGVGEIGGGEATVPVSQGAYSGTVTIAFNRWPEHPTDIPTSWRCVILVALSDGAPPTSMSRAANAEPWRRALDGSTFVTASDVVGATGNFPQ